MTRCEFTEQAEADLTEIALFIAEGSPRRALSFVAELRDKCAEITERPKVFRLREEYGPGVRVAVHRNYLIFYSVKEDAVVVEHIRHGYRNLEEFQL